MKKLLLLVVLTVLMMGLGDSLFAQQNHRDHESDFYYFNFPIEKIYVHRLGFIVIYRNGSNRVARTFLPEDWFITIGGVGEIIRLGSGPEWPSMTVYYRNGEFSHVRLRVRQHRGHVTWGVIPLSTSMDDYFDGIEEVHLEF